MFKKGPADIDKKKLLQKALDVKRDSFSRLRYFKTIFEHSDANEVPRLFSNQFSFIYHTFIDAVSNFDCNSKQRRDDLDCILFMLEKILVHNSDLIKKRWQFYSITFVMQKLLHRKNTWRLRQEGVRLFMLWYQILCDDSSIELQTIFESLVPGIIPQPTQQQQVQIPAYNQVPILPSSPPLLPPPHLIVNNDNIKYQQQNSVNNEIQPNHNSQSKLPPPNEPLVPATSNDPPPGDEISFYLDSLLQFMVTQTTKPRWPTLEETRYNQELSFSFAFKMFKRVYLNYLFPGLSPSLIDPAEDVSLQPLIQRYLLEESANADQTSRPSHKPRNHVELRHHHSSHTRGNNDSLTSNIDEEERLMTLTVYQSIVIKWITRILRQDMIPGQDELIKSGTGDKREFCNSGNDRGNSSSGASQEHELSHVSDGNSASIFQNMEINSREMAVARIVIGTWPENIAILHELFRRSFLNFYQPASMKRVVNVYKEWICNGGPTPAVGVGSSKTPQRIGYLSFGDLLQVFVLNSSKAFVCPVQNSAMLDEQVEMCKRIMNIYRYMVMRIFMNTTTWEQLLNVMLMITGRLFPIRPPERKEATIGGRIAPAFFQTFIVSWIRANLYVHISGSMWDEFHRVMRSLIEWRELIEEWSSTMSSLTRVLVKHVYGLNLSELPLDKVQDRRRKPRAMKSFSTAEANSPKHETTDTPNRESSPAENLTRSQIGQHIQKQQHQQQRNKTMTQTRQSTVMAAGSGREFKGLTRSNSDANISNRRNHKLYYTVSMHVDEFDRRHNADRALDYIYPYSRNQIRLRRIKSEYLLLETSLDNSSNRSEISTHPIDVSSLKDPNILLETDSAMDQNKGSSTSQRETISSQKKSPSDTKTSDRCVLLGGSVRGWTSENSVIMWRRTLGLFGNINNIREPENHSVAMKCLTLMLCDFIKARENLGVTTDNQSSPKRPDLIPPYIYTMGWLLEATQLPIQFKESSVTAHKLLCMMIIRRHDIELPMQFYVAFYEALRRGLCSRDHQIAGSILKNCAQILALELPGATLLSQDLFDCCRFLLLQQHPPPKDNSGYLEQAIQVLNGLLSLYRPIKKLSSTKPETSPTQDIRSRIFDTLLSCSSARLDTMTRLQALWSMALHLFQELCDRNESYEIEKLFDILMTDLEENSETGRDRDSFRANCDLLRVFAEHAVYLSHNRPMLVSSLIQTISRLIIRLSSEDSNKEAIHCLLICLEDWCISLGDNFLSRPIERLKVSNSNASGEGESLFDIILGSLESVINDEQSLDISSMSREKRGSIQSISRNTSDTQSNKSGLISSSGPGGRERTLTSGMTVNVSQSTGGIGGASIESEGAASIRLACRVSHLKLVTYLGHFPLRQVGPASMTCYVTEADYLCPLSQQGEQQELTDLKNTPDVNLLAIDETTLVTFIGPMMTGQSGGQKVHIILRNLCGKYSWDVDCVDDQLELARLAKSDVRALDREYIWVDPETFKQEENPRFGNMQRFDSDSDVAGDRSASSIGSGDRDCLGDILNSFLSSSSGGSSSQNTVCNNSSGSSFKRRNAAQSVVNPEYKLAQAEEAMIALLTNQRFQELNYCELRSTSNYSDRVMLTLGPNRSNQSQQQQQIGSRSTDATAASSGLASASCKKVSPDPTIDSAAASSSSFCSSNARRQLIQQLGYLAWEKRAKLEPLAKSTRLVRELKNLDSQRSRETHKIAVIYVAAGQEDRNSILMNASGSRQFEEFVAALGWEVNLASHLGFKGGLQSNKSTGETSPYFCNSTTEVMFHVSTRLPTPQSADDEDSLNKRLRHLGNDEIHIVWSEHWRDYRRGIIPTDFGDVIIAIYPMMTYLGYFRVQISSKPDVPPFGPLFDNCLVHQASLGALIRATAINASRAKRSRLTYYQAHFEERNRLIKTIVRNHQDPLSFEDYALQLYPTSLSCQPCSSTSSSGVSSMLSSAGPTNNKSNKLDHQQHLFHNSTGDTPSGIMEQISSVQ